MLYLAIDQHAKQITVCVRNEDGDTVLRRQVSTRRSKRSKRFFSSSPRWTPSSWRSLKSAVSTIG